MYYAQVAGVLGSQVDDSDGRELDIAVRKRLMPRSVGMYPKPFEVASGIRCKNMSQRWPTMAELRGM